MAVVFILMIVRLCSNVADNMSLSETSNTYAEIDSVTLHSFTVDSLMATWCGTNKCLYANANEPKHRIYSVSSFKKCFPDLNDVQLATATKLGVNGKIDDLVYVADNPYYKVQFLRASHPYLTQRAQLLLSHIGKTFIDSLMVKHIKPSKIIVTSILRTKEDIAKLRQYNGNASENSCHQYATTFDVCYNRYEPIYNPDSDDKVWQARNDTLKWVLSEVLNDQRKLGVCYVKYEVKQGCYHITVR